MFKHFFKKISVRHYSQSDRLAQNLFQVRLTPALSQTLTQTDCLNSEIQAVQKEINSDLRQHIHEKLRAEWTYNSNAIEGSKLTLGDTIFFLREGLTVQGKPFKDFLDTKNHVEAIDYLYEIIQDKERMIDPTLIKQTNAVLLKGVETLSAVDPSGSHVKRTIYPGHYKKHPNHVLTMSGDIHHYVEPSDVAPQMDDLFDWINEKLTDKSMHPLIIAAAGHYNLVRIHPFDDGNGRTARILMNLILLKSNFSVAIVRNEERHQYLTLLNQVDKTGELESFIRFIGESLIMTQETILSQIKQNGYSDYPTKPKI